MQAPSNTNAEHKTVFTEMFDQLFDAKRYLFNQIFVSPHIGGQSTSFTEEQTEQFPIKKIEICPHNVLTT